MTSRYFFLRAEQATTTPDGADGGAGAAWVVAFVVCEDEDDEEGGERRVVAALRREMSQSQRSASVRGVPVDILALLEAGWNCRYFISFFMYTSPGRGAYIITLEKRHAEFLLQVPPNGALPASCWPRDDPDMLERLQGDRHGDLV